MRCPELATTNHLIKKEAARRLKKQKRRLDLTNNVSILQNFLNLSSGRKIGSVLKTRCVNRMQCGIIITKVTNY